MARRGIAGGSGVADAVSVLKAAKQAWDMAANQLNGGVSPLAVVPVMLKTVSLSLLFLLALGLLFAAYASLPLG
jgi:hypothetical protein